MKDLVVSLVVLALPVALGNPAGAQNARGADEQCDIVLKVKPAERRLEAAGTLRLRAANTARESVSLSLRADMGDLHVEVSAPQECSGPAVSRKKGSPDRDKNQAWIVQPRRAFPAGADILLSFSYTGGKTQSLVFRLGPEGSFAGGPNTAWYPQFEAGRSTGSLRFEVPKGLVVKATGDQVHGGDERNSAVFEFKVTQPSMYSFAIGKYTIRRHEGRVPTTLYLMRDWEFAEEMVRGLGKVMDVLVREFGPYPYGTEFAIVETPSPQSELSGFDGASIEGFMFVSSSALKRGFNLALFGHELAHQWWGNLIKHTGEKGSYMIDEAMAQYGSLRCVEELDGPAAAARYRRSGYPGYSSSQCGDGALKLWAKGSDHTLENLPRSSVSHTLADSKGFLVYHMLARTIGPDRFRRALHQMTEKHAFGTATWQEFTDTVQNAAGRALDWFYDQWFRRTGAPVLALEWAQEQDKLRCTIRQTEPTYQLSVPLVVELEGKEPVTQDAEVSGAKTEVVLPATAKVSAVALDPLYHVHHMTPAVEAELKKNRK